MWYMELIPEFIYLNNGELNWDAISTISNFILVSLLVLVALYEAHERTKSMKKAQERIIVLDMIKNFLYPCLKEMKKTIQKINNNEFYWNWNQSTGKSQISFIKKNCDSTYGTNYAKTDVFKKHHELEVLCSENDKLLDEIIEVHDKIKITIEDTADKDCLIKILYKFIQETGINFEEAKNDPAHYFIQVLVNLKIFQENENDNLYSNKNEIEFIKFDRKIIDCINTNEYKKLDKDRYIKIDLFADKINEIIEKCEEMIDYYRRAYHISEDEMNGNMTGEFYNKTYI